MSKTSATLSTILLFLLAGIFFYSCQQEMDPIEAAGELSREVIDRFNEGYKNE